MRSLPLRWRVSLLVSIVIAVVIAVVSIIAYVELRESLLRSIDSALAVMANGIVAELSEGETHEDLDAEVRSITGRTNRSRSVFFRVWMDGVEVDLTVSDPPSSGLGRWLGDLAGARPPGLGGSQFFEAHVDEGYRVLWRRAKTAGGVVNVVVGYSSRRAYHELHEFLRALAILGGGMVVGSALVATLVVFWALRPIGHAAARLRRITPANLTREDLADLDEPGELKPFMTALREMLARLDKVFQRQKQFTADASHELRTPLAVAKSTLQTTRAVGRDIESYRRAVDETVHDLDRMERLIGQLLALARLDETEAPPQADEIRLDSLLGELAERYHAEAARSGGRVLAEDLPAVVVRGDGGQLEQLFGNLLDNAIKHGPEAGTVRVRLRTDADGRCTAGIHDEGGPIAPEVLARLFDRFYRADSSRTRATGGTGLGLAIAREIARRHGGDIEITSAAAGTEASVHLPRV